jgi:hypothetical protein
MSFIVLILAFAGTLVASCAPKGNIGDYIPQWAGGPPKNLPRDQAPQNTTSLNEGSTRKPLATRATTLRVKSRQVAQGVLARSVKRGKKVAWGNLSYSKRKLLRKGR